MKKNELVAYIEPNVYSQMYDIYKNKTAENVFKKLDDYALDIPSDTVEDIKKFVPVKK